MAEPIFRYIVVLVAAIVVIRILLGISASKMQENNSKIDQAAMENQVDQTDTPEVDQEVALKGQVQNPEDEETNYE